MSISYFDFMARSYSRIKHYF